MTEKLFETALGIDPPWAVAGADFDAQARTLTIRVDFMVGSERRGGWLTSFMSSI